MTIKEFEQKTITIHWWNMRSKTLDFKGSYKDYFKKRDIRVVKITHPIYKDIEGKRFYISVSSSTVKFDAFNNDIIYDYNKAIIIFLTLMGDKAKLIDSYNREYKINWR